MLDTCGDDDRTESQLLCNSGKTSGRMESEFDREGLVDTSFGVVDQTSQRPFPDKSGSPTQRAQVLSARSFQSDHIWGTMLLYQYAYGCARHLGHPRAYNHHKSPKTR